MKKIKHQKKLSLFLIVIFLCAGLTCFKTEDANKDFKIDLKDAVLNAQKSHCESKTQMPDGKMEACILAMEVVAGIKYLSTSSGDSEDFTFMNLCFLISTAGEFQFFTSREEVSDSLSAFESIVSQPAVFPPIFS